MIGRQVHHYRIIEKLGEGGMGVVYRALDTRLQRVVALKFLHPSITASAADSHRLVAEARAAAALSHPNICTVYEVNEADGRTFIAMQYVDGSTLRDRVLSGRIGIAEALGFVLEVADGLQQAHARGIIHRDMKSSNIMITPTGHAMIMDFGLARPPGAPHADERFSSRGTASYLSPEQARGEPVDSRSDIWSLGVVLYEMLAGQLPFSGEHEQAVRQSILNGIPRPIGPLCPEAPPAVLRIVERCLEREPRRRYQTLDEFAAEVKRALESVRGLPRGRPWSRRRVAGLAAAAVLTLVASRVTHDFLRGRQAGGGERVPIAVIDFNNDTDEPALDGLSGMLITALEQSRRLQVMTRSRMFDTARALGRGEAPRIDESLGQRICEAAGVDALVIPTIRRFGDLYTIDLKVLDTRHNRYVYTAREEGRGSESIPRMIDEIARGIRIDLRDSSDAVALTAPVGQVTTANLDAYQAYFEGEALLNRLDFEGAARRFQKAIEHDSSFALAYYRLAYTEWWSRGRQEAAKHHIVYAVHNLVRIPQKERFLVRALHAALMDGFEAQIPILTEMRRLYPDDKEMLFGLGDAEFHTARYDSARAHLAAALAVDPLMERSLQHLAWTYQAMGRLDDAVATARRWVESTHSIEAYEYLAGCYARAGKTDEAIDALEVARARAPDNPLIPLRAAGVLFMLRRPEEAADQVKAAEQLLGDREDFYARGELLRVRAAVLYPYFGRYRDVERVLDEGLSAIERAGGDSLALWGIEAARVALGYWGYGDSERVRWRLSRLNERGPRYPTGDIAQSMVVFNLIAGDTARARAIEIANAAKLAALNRRVLESVRATVEGDCEPASRLAGLGASVLGPARTSPEFLRYLSARCHLHTGQAREAIDELRAVVDSPLFNAEAAPIYPCAYFELGRAYEASGDARNARAAYQALLSLWRYGDGDLPLRAQARARLRALGSSM